MAGHRRVWNGKLLFEHGFADKEYLFGWLLSYGKYVELLEPENLRDEFEKMLKEAAEKYSLNMTYRCRVRHVILALKTGTP